MEDLIGRVSKLETAKPSDGKNGKDGTDGKPGKDGSNGRGVATASIDSSGSLILKMTDGQTIDAGKVVAKSGEPGKNGSDGKDGKDGKDGRGIQDVAVNPAGLLVITYTDGKSVIAGKVLGPQGPQGGPGPQGEKGEQGDKGVIKVEVIREGRVAETFDDVEDQSRLNVRVISKTSNKE